jgi:hypothetical protein
MKTIKTFEEYSSLSISLDGKVKMKIKLGDEIFSGKFKNKKIKVKSINTNDKGDITINGKPFNKMRTIKKED